MVLLAGPSSTARAPGWFCQVFKAQPQVDGASLKQFALCLDHLQLITLKQALTAHHFKADSESQRRVLSGAGVS